MLQRRVLCLRLSGELHPPVAGRAGLRHRRDALHRSGGLRGLRRLRQRLPGRRHRAGHQADRRRSCRSSSSTPASTRNGREGKLPPTSKLAPVLPAPVVRRGAVPLTVAIVGSGPAAMYAADELLTQRGVRVNVFEKLPTPYGLVRAGVAPDHQSTKGVTAAVRPDQPRGAASPSISMSKSGEHLSHAELLEHHHAVLYAVGAPDDRRLDIDGMGLPGTGTATETVAWINGHPDFADLPVDLSHERVVIIGNGNVALDVARILTADPDALARTDISDARAGGAARLGGARGRHRRPARPGRLGVHAARADRADRRPPRWCSTPTTTTWSERDLAAVDDPVTASKLEILAKLPRRRRRRPTRPANPVGLPADPAADRSATDRVERRRVPPHRHRRAGAPGRRAGAHLDRLPRQADRGSAVRRVRGRGAQRRRPGDRPGHRRPVAGAYVAGWIKRGPTGFIGTNKSCAMQTVSQPGRRLQRRAADRSGRAARRAGAGWSATAGPRSSTRPAGGPSTPPRSPAAKPPGVPG